MKDVLLQMMVAMMPYMKPLFWAGIVIAALGLLLRIGKPVLGMSGLYDSGLIWAARIAGALGIFFLICEVMGAFLGAEPKFNLGDSTKFEFWMVSFWQVGIGLLAAAVLAGYGISRTRSA